MDPRGNNVRLTEEAHGLLAEMAHDCDSSMKEIASEAIFSLIKSHTKDKECIAHLERLQERIKRLQKIVRDNRRYALGAFALGALASGCVMFLIGVLW